MIRTIPIHKMLRKPSSPTKANVEDLQRDMTYSSPTEIGKCLHTDLQFQHKGRKRLRCGTMICCGRMFWSIHNHDLHQQTEHEKICGKCNTFVEVFNPYPIWHIITEESVELSSAHKSQKSTTVLSTIANEKDLRTQYKNFIQDIDILRIPPT